MKTRNSLENWYPYRFKTKEEFIDEFGFYWRNANGKSHVSFIDYMDHLLGKEYPFYMDLNDCYDYSYLPNDNILLYDPRINGHWIICKFMLIKNKSLIPDYKSKSKIVRSL